MSSTEYALLVSVIGQVFAHFGITGLEPASINGFLQVSGAIITLVGLLVAWVTHRAAIKSSN